MGVVHCVYVWVLTDYKYVITSLVAQNSTQKTKQFWKGEANFQFIYFTEKRRSAALKCMSSFLWVFLHDFGPVPVVFLATVIFLLIAQSGKGVLYIVDLGKNIVLVPWFFFSFFHEVVFRPMDFFVSTLLALFQAEPEMPNNVSKHRWIPINVFRVSLIGTN